MKVFLFKTNEPSLTVMDKIRGGVLFKFDKFGHYITDNEYVISKARFRFDNVPFNSLKEALAYKEELEEQFGVESTDEIVEEDEEDEVTPEVVESVVQAVIEEAKEQQVTIDDVINDIVHEGEPKDDSDDEDVADDVKPEEGALNDDLEDDSNETEDNSGLELAESEEVDSNLDEITPDVDLSNMTKQELIEFAKTNYNVVLSKYLTVDDIIVRIGNMMKEGK